MTTPADPGAAFTLRRAASCAEEARAPRKVTLVAVLRRPTYRQSIGRKVLQRLRRGKLRRYALSGSSFPSRGLAAGPYVLRVCAQSPRAGITLPKRFLTISGGIDANADADRGPDSDRDSGCVDRDAPPPTPSPTASPRRHRLAVGVASPSPTATATPPSPPRPPPRPPPRLRARSGAETVGDRLFPHLGNGGYDAQGYDLALTYTPDPRADHGRDARRAPPR